MPNLLGPSAFGAARAATSRPGVTPNSAGNDTFFQDCSSPTARDGTEIRAGWLNVVSALLRAVIRGGQVTEDNSDDMLLRAVRSQRMNFAAATAVGGSANAITLAFSPTFASLSDLVGVPLRFVVEANSTNNVTVAVDGLAATALHYVNGDQIGNGGLISGRIIEIMYDGTRFVCLAGALAAAGHTHPQSDIINLVADLAAINAAIAGKVAKAGDTMTGDLTIAKTWPALIMNRPAAGTGALLLSRVASLTRWAAYFGDPTSESGANSGSNFRLERYDDTGNLVDTVLSALRSNGFVGIGTSTPQHMLHVAGAIASIVGSSGVQLSGVDGGIEIARNGGGAFIDLKDALGEDFDSRISRITDGVGFTGGGLQFETFLRANGGVGSSGHLLTGGSSASWKTLAELGIGSRVIASGQVSATTASVTFPATEPNTGYQGMVIGGAPHIDGVQTSSIVKGALSAKTNNGCTVSLSGTPPGSDLFMQYIIFRQT